jgi:hypothetical protein
MTESITIITPRVIDATEEERLRENLVDSLPGCDVFLTIVHSVTTRSIIIDSKRVSFRTVTFALDEALGESI